MSDNLKVKNNFLCYKSRHVPHISQKPININKFSNNMEGNMFNRRFLEEVSFFRKIYNPRESSLDRVKTLYFSCVSLKKKIKKQKIMVNILVFFFFGQK